MVATCAFQTVSQCSKFFQDDPLIMMKFSFAGELNFTLPYQVLIHSVGWFQRFSIYGEYNYENNPQRHRGSHTNHAYEIVKISGSKVRNDLKIDRKVINVAVEQKITLLKRKNHSERI